MASSLLITDNGLSIQKENWKVSAGNSKCLGRYRSPYSSLTHSSMRCRRVSAPLLKLNYSCCISPRSCLSCSSKIRSVVNENNRINPRLNKEETNASRNKLASRLRPGLRLLSKRLKIFNVKSALSRLTTFLRKNVRRVALVTSISALLGLCFLFLRFTAMPSPKVVPYSELVESLQTGSVTKVQFEEGTRRIYFNTNPLTVENAQTVDDNNMVSVPENEADTSGSTEESNDGNGRDVLVKKSNTRAPRPVWQFSTRKIDHDESYLLNLMREKGTKYGSAPQSALMSIRSLLITVLSLWIPLTPLMWLLYRQLSAANSPAKKRKPSSRVVSFDDVEGVDAAKAELMEVVSCLQGAINYSKLGAKLPRGLLLVGPPGTGKTLLARAVAGEAGLPFFSVSASEFVELFVGRGAARIRDLFAVARKNAPAIVFIDELDAVGGKRGRSFNDERDQTLNQLLTEMDGFESDINVIVIAATNRPEALDPALCRPGRFSRKIYVGEPDEDGRRRILAVHLRGIPLEEDRNIICNLVASLTQGFVGADLANIINEAALLAARRGAECVAREDIMEAIERAKFGIDNRQSSRSSLTKEIEKLFPWMPSLMGRNDTRSDGTEGLLGYQTLS